MSNEQTQLYDSHGREVSDLRISVTDRCNFRCTYCMPSDGIQWINNSEILSYEEIARIVRVFKTMGVKTVRLTGGEPLVRKDLPVLVNLLSQLALEDLSLTTNGFLLKDQLPALVKAGLNRINVSLDALSVEGFAAVTRRPKALQRVLDSLATAERYPELHPLKVNVVALKDFTEREVLGFAELARKKPYIIRFIEFMPLDADHNWTSTKVLTGQEIRTIIESHYQLEELPTEAHATARNYRFSDGKGTVGFVSPVSEPFCASCNRVRLTADGKLRTCLFSHKETDLKNQLRSGINDQDLGKIIRTAIWEKEPGHLISKPSFRQPRRTMSQIGG